MKQENILLTIALLALGGYVVWNHSKKSVPTEPIAESPKDEVPVEVVESQKLSANAAITKPSFALPTFQKDWVLMQNDIKTGRIATNSHFN